MTDHYAAMALQIAVVLLLVLLNAFFVAAEFSIVKIRSSQVALRVKEGDPRAALAKRITTHLDAYLAACQVGITFASLGLGWIGEPVVAELLRPVFALLGVADELLLHTVSFVVAFGLITFLHVVFGELAPKTIAIRTAESTALRLARPLHAFYLLFWPLIVGLNGAGNRVVRVLGFAPTGIAEALHSEAELREILLGVNPAPGSRVQALLNLLELKALRAGDIMTPVTRVVALDLRKPLEDNLRIAEDSGYSRFPLVDGSLDHVVGMAHFKDLNKILRSDKPEQSLKDIQRGSLFVPEGESVEHLLAELIRRAQHMAIVVDEHGRTVGVVTLEDVFEEVFGSIRDEFDEAEAPYKPLEGGRYVVDGTMGIRDLEALVALKLRKPGVTTVSGYIIESLGRLPMPGERFQLGQMEVAIREVGRRRVKSVEIKPLRLGRRG